MPKAAPPKPRRDPAAFNSLFEMQQQLGGRWQPRNVDAFNSLFEMPIVLAAAVLPPGLALSILYLRCLATTP